MRFPNSEKLALPVYFERYIAGRQHPDGRRYLPQLIMRVPGGALLGVVDRHHYVDERAAGHDGIARLVFLLGNLMLRRDGEVRLGIDAPAPGRIETAPAVHGRVLEIPTWELGRGQLPYEALFVELLLETGNGVVGVRTSVTAGDIAARIGTQRLKPGDLLSVTRSRIDILGFEARQGAGGEGQVEEHQHARSDP